MLKQKKTHWITVPIVMLFFTVFPEFLFPEVLQAEDCVRMRATFKKLKGVVQRKVFLEKAIIECTDDPEITYYYAYNMERLRKYDIALQYYQKVIALDQNYAKAYLGMGDMYREFGQLDKAISSYEKGLSLDPDNVWARRSLQDAKSVYPLKTKVPVKDVKIVKEDNKKTNAETIKREKASLKSESLKVEDVSAADFIHAMGQKKDLAGEYSKINKGHSINIQIQFELNSGYLSDDAMSTLDKVICPALQSEELKEMRFEVVGHTDNSGDKTMNMNISRLRAYTVKAYLETRCNVTPDRLEVSFQGPNEPLVPNTSLENRQRNRRVEFRRL